MSSVEVKQIIPLEGTTKVLVAYADVAFDSAHGPYIAFWEVFEYRFGVKRDFLLTAKIQELPYNHFMQVTEAIETMCENALVNETIYADLENMHAQRYNDR